MTDQYTTPPTTNWQRVTAGAVTTDDLLAEITAQAAAAVAAAAAAAASIATVQASAAQASTSETNAAASAVSAAVAANAALVSANAAQASANAAQDSATQIADALSQVLTVTDVAQAAADAATAAVASVQAAVDAATAEADSANAAAIAANAAAVNAGGGAIFAVDMAGADFSIKIQAAHDALPSTGGLIDARGFQTSQVLSQDIVISKPGVRILWGNHIVFCRGFRLKTTATAAGFMEEGFSSFGVNRVFGSTGGTFWIQDGGAATYGPRLYGDVSGTAYLYAITARNIGFSTIGAPNPVSGMTAIRTWNLVFGLFEGCAFFCDRTAYNQTCVQVDGAGGAHTSSQIHFDSCVVNGGGRGWHFRGGSTTCTITNGVYDGDPVHAYAVQVDQASNGIRGSLHVDGALVAVVFASAASGCHFEITPYAAAQDIYFDSDTFGNRVHINKPTAAVVTDLSTGANSWSDESTRAGRVNFTTAAMLSNGTTEGVVYMGGDGLITGIISTNRIWLRLYGNQNDFLADAGRLQSEDPTTPVQYDAILDTSLDIWSIFPAPYANLENPYQGRLYYRVTLLDDTSGGAIAPTITIRKDRR
jgi:hypothetical protein